MGGSKTDPGIFINWSLRLGTTASTCITFDKFWPISRDLVFDIRTLELWVVNEVLMKKRNVPKRDFYSTVVMWNRLGKHKANVKARDYRMEQRECCFHNGVTNFRNHTPNCSPVEVHETEQRHFEPSNTSLTGTNNLDDELLIAIKNRLAGVPPLPGALSFKPEPNSEGFNLECPKSNKPLPYLVSSDPSKPKKVPTPVSTQVDDSMITELKHQGTSTSHVKVTSTFTQSVIDGGLTQRRAETTQVRQSSSRMNRVDEGFQRSSNLDQNTHYSSRIDRVEDGFQRASHLAQNPYPYNPERSQSRTHHLDEQDHDTQQPQHHSFPNQVRHSVQSQIALSSHNDDGGPAPVIGDLQQSHTLPRLSEASNYHPVSAERPSVSRSVRSTMDESSLNHQFHELSRTAMRKNTEVTLPHQQHLVHATTNATPNPQVRNSIFNPQQMMDAHSQPPYSPIGDSSSNPYVSPSPVVSGGGEEAHRSYSPPRGIGPSYGRPSVYSYHPTSSPPRMPPQAQTPLPEEQTVLAMTTQQICSSQMCKCGSRELNMACFCKKSIIKEIECARVEESRKECRCNKAVIDSDDNSNSKKKKKKEKKAKPDKEAKAEEKRRKKEEKEREKREKKEQKAKEKESRKSKCKDKSKNSKSKKGKKSNAVMCSCCKCHGAEETTIVPSETSLSQNSEDKCKKKSKKEKKPKEKKEKKPKEKKKKKTKVCEEPPFRSCECAPIQTQHNEQLEGFNSSCRMSVMHNPPTGVVQGCCNHPELPCPALVKKEMCNTLGIEGSASSLSHVPLTTSKDNCGDPVCTNATKRNHTVHVTTTRSCNCCPPKPERDYSHERAPTVCQTRVCANIALMEPPQNVYPSPTRSNTPSRTQNFSQTRTTLANVNGLVRSSPPRTNSRDARDDTMRYKDFTAAPAIILPNENGRGDATEALPFAGRWQSDPRFSSAPAGFTTHDSVLIDLSKRGRENSANKRYVPPCVLYLDCTKVKDLCVIIKDKYEDPS